MSLISVKKQYCFVVGLHCIVRCGRLHCALWYIALRVVAHCIVRCGPFHCVLRWLHCIVFCDIGLLSN